MNKNKKLKILVTGCAGFIGYHLCKELTKNKEISLYGIDNLNNYYDLDLKKNRLRKLTNKISNFKFYKIDIENYTKIKNNFKVNKYDYVIHLAAQAGVRYSIDNPKVYVDTNINGFFNIIDNCKNFHIKHFIYASTSSVYGDSKKFPLKENFDTSSPQSFYAATKKTNEVIAYAYSSIYKLPSTGLRFFTVYGPYGRPDMALFKFTKAIEDGKKLELFNRGNHIRDFTYVDDITVSIKKLIKKQKKSKVPYQVFNIGSGNPQKLTKFLFWIEQELKKKSSKIMRNFQLGDVFKTHADISALTKKIKFKPKTNINLGIKEFIRWYKEYYNK